MNIEEEEKLAMKAILNHCHDPEKHRIKTLEAFKEHGGQICPICIFEAYQQLGLYALAVIVQVEHGVMPDVRRMKYILEQTVPKKVMEKAEANLAEKIKRVN